MNLKNKNLSIAIPTFNGVRTIKKTLDTIVNNKNVDIVISDNCSDDGTKEILKMYASNFSNIKINFNPINIGFDNNLMKCVELCTTKYVWLLTDDDLIKDNAVAIVNNIIDNNNDEYGLIYVDNLFEYSGIKKSIFGSNPNEFFQYSKFRSGGMSSNIINRRLWNNINFKMYPKDWPHLVYAIISLTNSNFYIHNESLKSEINLNEEKRWLKNSNLFNYLFTLKETFDIMKNFSIYSNKTIKSSKKVLHKHISTAIIINKKKNIKFDLKTLIFIFKYSKKYIIKNFILLILPKRIYEFIKSIH